MDIALSKRIEQALAEYKLCTRATILLGDVEAQQGNHTAAITGWQRIESQNPAFLSLVAERLADGYRRMGSSAQALRVVTAYQRQYPSLDLLNTAFTLTLASLAPIRCGVTNRSSSTRSQVVSTWLKNTSPMIGMSPKTGLFCCERRLPLR